MAHFLKVHIQYPFHFINPAFFVRVFHHLLSFHNFIFCRVFVGQNVPEHVLYVLHIQLVVFPAIQENWIGAVICRPCICLKHFLWNFSKSVFVSL